MVLDSLCILDIRDNICAHDLFKGYVPGNFYEIGIWIALLMMIELQVERLQVLGLRCLPTDISSIHGKSESD